LKRKYKRAISPTEKRGAKNEERYNLNSRKRLEKMDTQRRGQIEEFFKDNLTSNISGSSWAGGGEHHGNTTECDLEFCPGHPRWQSRIGTWERRLERRFYAEDGYQIAVDV
jgi:hypothetical protein